MGGGYSPKVYDSHYIHSVRREIRKQLKGATMVADGHFVNTGRMKNVYFKTPFPKPTIQKGRRSGAGVTKLDKAKREYNIKQKAL